MPGGFVPGAQQLSYLQVATLSYTCCTYLTYQATALFEQQLRLRSIVA